MSLSLIPTPCTLNTQQNAISIKLGMDGLVVKSHDPKTIKSGNASAKFFKPFVLQPEEQRQEKSIESSISHSL